MLGHPFISIPKACLHLSVKNLSNTIKPVILFGVTHPLSGIDGMEDKDIEITSPTGSYSTIQKQLAYGDRAMIDGLRLSVSKERQFHYLLRLQHLTNFGEDIPLATVRPNKCRSIILMNISNEADIFPFKMDLDLGTYM